MNRRLALGLAGVEAFPSSGWRWTTRVVITRRTLVSGTVDPAPMVFWGYAERAPNGRHSPVTLQRSLLELNPGYALVVTREVLDNMEYKISSVDTSSVN